MSSHEVQVIRAVTLLEEHVMPEIREVKAEMKKMREALDSDVEQINKRIDAERAARLAWENRGVGFLAGFGVLTGTIGALLSKWLGALFNGGPPTGG